MNTFKNIYSSFSVNDLAKAKEFYGGTLGLDVAEGHGGLTLDGGKVFIYESPANKPADFTILNLAVDDIDQAVAEMAGKGIQMEHYDMPGGIKTDEKGIARAPGDKPDWPRGMAWFKDPFGNILALMQQK